MAAQNIPLAPPAERNDRDHFAPVRVIFFVIVHLGIIAALWHTTWSAIGIFFLLYMICGGLGICVGYHRLLTHRSFKTPRIVEYALATLGALSMQGGPIEWVALHRKHHQYSDKEGDPHSAADGFWWSHMLWVLWTPSRKKWKEITAKYAPDLAKQRFYRVLEPVNYVVAILTAIGLYLLGGWSWVIWGMCVRLVTTYHITWFVNSASHMFGYKTYESNDRSTNCWWVAILAYGEGWHNNHHAFPTSARHGLGRWEIDFSWIVIRVMKLVGLAKDVYVPDQKLLEAKAIAKS
jgi:fatty-acid desaturase